MVVLPASNPRNFSWKRVDSLLHLASVWRWRFSSWHKPRTVQDDIAIGVRVFDHNVNNTRVKLERSECPKRSFIGWFSLVEQNLLNAATCVQGDGNIGCAIGVGGPSELQLVVAGLGNFEGIFGGLASLPSVAVVTVMRAEEWPV